MYKVFLCLRYLRSRMIAYFAMLGVALCVAMMLIAVSVMTGFLNKVEDAARGLFGDIVVDAGSMGGLGYYGEFIDEVVREVPEVEAGSPFILAYGVLAVPGTAHRQPVQIAGIRLPERAKVTDFEQGLFVQAGWEAPTFDPPVTEMIRRVQADMHHVRQILDRFESAAEPRPDLAELRRRLINSISYHRSALESLRAARPYQQELRRLQERINEQQRRVREATGETFEAKEREVNLLREELVGPGKLEDQAGFQSPARRVILGLGLDALSWTTPTGETVRVILPGHKIALGLIPAGDIGFDLTSLSTVTREFTVVDDCRTDVFSIDKSFVYLPFETLQRLNHLGPEYAAEDPTEVVVPARCNQVHFKVAPAYSNGARLEGVCAKVRGVWGRFRRRRPEAAVYEVSVESWRERQWNLISALDRQRTLVYIMFGVISLVSVVLIFVIFYMIVFQKTKDIGVLKAVGASGGGVAQIFLAWGSAVGLIGALLGTGLGYLFVRNINPIQDWVDRTFGYRVWSKEYFLFAKIPNEVDWGAALLIAIGAVLAGLVGALLPALRAARMQPVEAIRYE